MVKNGSSTVNHPKKKKKRVIPENVVHSKVMCKMCAWMKSITDTNVSFYRFGRKKVYWYKPLCLKSQHESIAGPNRDNISPPSGDLHQINTIISAHKRPQFTQPPKLHLDHHYQATQIHSSVFHSTSHAQ